MDYALPTSETQYTDTDEAATAAFFSRRLGQAQAPPAPTWAEAQAATFAACYRAACAAMAGHEPELIRFAAGEIYRKAQAIA